METRLLFVFAGAAAVAWSVTRWRKAVQLAMVLLILEGAIRKWLFPGAQDLVYFAKDVFLVGAYIGYFRQRGTLRYRPYPLPLLYGVLAISAMFGLLQMFNPNLPNILVGVFGFKAYFLYVPLLFILPVVFPSDAALARFLRLYVLISIPVGALAVLQFLSPNSSMLNTYARPSDSEISQVSTFGTSEFVRATGTFSYITGYASYLLATSILILAILATRRWRFRGSFLVYVALGMTILGMLMTGSRGPVLMLGALLPLYWWLAVARERQGVSTFARAALAVALVAGFVSIVGSSAFSAFQGRASAGAAEVPMRILFPFSLPFRVLPEVGLLGYGIGSTHQTAAAVAKGVPAYSWLRGLIVEAETGRVMVELGPLGFFLVYFTRLYLAGLALRQVFSLKTLFHRSVAISCLLFFLAQIPGSIVFDVTADLFYWFFAGLLLLVIRLDRIAVAAMARDAGAGGSDGSGGTSTPVRRLEPVLVAQSRAGSKAPP
jgi:hypothetical protein